MKKIRKIFLLCSIVLLILVLMGYFLPRKVHIERTIIVNTAPDIVFNHINTIKTWINWSPWYKSTHIGTIAFSGPEAGVGATLHYTGTDRQLRNGRVSIIKSIPYSLIASNLDFAEHGQTSCIFRFKESEAGTFVTMALESTLRNDPFSRWIGRIMDNLVGSELENSLINIRSVCDSISDLTGNQVVERNIPSRIILGVRDTASPATFRTQLERSYAELNEFLLANHLKINGFPMVLYHSVSARLLDIEACVPIERVVNSSGTVICRTLPPTRSVMTVFNGYGRADTIAYRALENYLLKSNLIISGACWEEYVTDPVKTSDTTKWQTHIFYPVK